MIAIVKSLQMQIPTHPTPSIFRTYPPETEDDLSSPLHKRIEQKSCIEGSSNSSNPSSLSFSPRSKHDFMCIDKNR